MGVRFFWTELNLSSFSLTPYSTDQGTEIHINIKTDAEKNPLISSGPCSLTSVILPRTETFQGDAVKGLPNLTHVLFLGLWFQGLAFSTGNRFTPKSLQRRFRRHSCEVTKRSAAYFWRRKGKPRKKWEVIVFQVQTTPSHTHTCIYFGVSPHKGMPLASENNTHTHTHFIHTHPQTAMTDHTVEQFLF